MCADLGHVLLSGGRYVDDNEIVLSLKKMDTDLKWPALLEGWASLTTGVSELMKGTSVYVIGASITINWAVAKELATGLGYVPLQTEQLIQELTSRSPIQLAAEEGDKSVMEPEDMILSSLSSYALSAAFQLVCPKMVAGMVCMPGSQCGYPKAVAGPICAPLYV
jgi:hypothetical protein